MNPKHLHTPVSTRVRCPVCHESVYSRAGIHPQCAARRSEPPRPKGRAPAVPGPDGQAEKVAVQAEAVGGPQSRTSSGLTSAQCPEIGAISARMAEEPRDFV